MGTELRRIWPTVVIAGSGWMLAAVVAFCGGTGNHNSGTDGILDVLADDALDGTAVSGGSLWVVDKMGQGVGIVVGRRSSAAGDDILLDAVELYNPSLDLFYTIHMVTGEVVQPAKLFFSGSSCTGEVGIRASCVDCPSGYNLAFTTGGVWYRVAGGVMRESFIYSSYRPEEVGAPCTAHGTSETYVYAAEPLPPQSSPPGYVPPLRFLWVNSRN